MDVALTAIGLVHRRILLLRDDGRFQWYFTYGALDLAAEGRWRREGVNVVLLPDVFQAPPQYPGTEYKRMHSIYDLPGHADVAIRITVLDPSS